ncbi:MAG: N-acetyltransferase family protein [Bacillota bacterium]|nr:N-acetyltransferase family protein [Bacillota bacterium]
MKIEKMLPEHWDKVDNIYKQGIESNLSTFRTCVPPWNDWNKSHLQSCRLIATEGESIVGWAALTPHGGNCGYKGVAEISIYVDSSYRHNGCGTKLIKELILEAEKCGFWTLESIIIAENKPSVELFSKCGFRIVGRREKIGRTPDGIWHDTIVMEYRNKFGLA